MEFVKRFLILSQDAAFAFLGSVCLLLLKVVLLLSNSSMLTCDEIKSCLTNSIIVRFRLSSEAKMVNQPWNKVHHFQCSSVSFWPFEIKLAWLDAPWPTLQGWHGFFTTKGRFWKWCSLTQRNCDSDIVPVPRPHEHHWEQRKIPRDFFFACNSSARISVTGLGMGLVITLGR